MNTYNGSSLLRRILDPLIAAPSILLAYVMFVIFVSLANVLLMQLAMEPLNARLVPYTGWIISGIYMFTIYWALALIYMQKRRRFVRNCIVMLMLFQVVSHLNVWSLMNRDTFDNPYLTVSPWQPVWTILIPCIWIALFFTPPMNRFCRVRSGAA